MYDILMWLGGVYSVYRASQDAGVWFFQLDSEARQAYMESFFVTKGMM